MKETLIQIQNWFFATRLGGLYFEFLLWLDRHQDKPSQYLTPKEMAQVIAQYSLLGEGVTKVKRKINNLIVAKTADEYDKTLKEIEDLMVLAERSKDSPQAVFSEALRHMYVKKGNKDIVTHTDKAKMIEGRIEDFMELRKQKESRSMLREIRKLRKEEKVDIADNLEKEWKDKYGKNRRS